MRHPHAALPTDFSDFAAIDAHRLSARNPIVPVEWAPLASRGVHFYVKREDLIDRQVSGNKLYKLLGHLQLACQQQAKLLISFGGYYSNHLHALAALGERMGVKTFGVVRGERPAKLNPMLLDCVAFGMQLEFVSRDSYREKDSPAFLQSLHQRFSNAYIIPEGGAGPAGLIGCQALGRYVSTEYRDKSLTLCVPCGTGTTLAGLVSGVQSTGELEHHCEGFAVVKPRKTDVPLEVDVRDWLGGVSMADISMGDSTERWRVNYDYHAGGYAKLPESLLAFIRRFERETNIALDPVYTAKMFWGIQCLAEQGRWQSGEHVVAIHTGGLQGRRGYEALNEGAAALSTE